ncbi:MAG: amidohydrolase [Acidimicrobiia bacterium]|nr:amidohydrolase [Acidimicrobiia bacterium]
MKSFWSSLALAACAFAADPVDWIVTGRYVVTMDSTRRVIENGALAIRGDSIVEAGPAAGIANKYTGKRIDRPGAAILPGLINTHTHAPMSLLRGIADDLRLQEWLEKYIFPAEARNVTAEFCAWGTRLAALEMLESGTTTYTDMYYFEDSIAEATKEAGMRGVLGQTIIGFPVPDAKTPADALRFTEGFLKKYAGDPLIVPAVAPHALYTNSDETLKASRALANRHSAPLLIHLSETKRENGEIVAKRGLSPTRVLESLGLFEGRTLAAHAVWVDEADMQILKARGVGVAHCPSSNMKLASGVAPVTRMLSMGIPVGLGPDGPAGSNNDFNLFEEMDLAAKLQKVTTGDPQALPAEQALAMATIFGARALGLDKQIGSLEAGKKADWIAVSLEGAHAAPLYQIYSQIVYALKGSDVSDVMVNGRVVVRGGEVVSLKKREILAKAKEYQVRILRSLQQ